MLILVEYGFSKYPTTSSKQSLNTIELQVFSFICCLYLDFKVSYSLIKSELHHFDKSIWLENC